jgi:hypothetical protein
MVYWLSLAIVGVVAIAGARNAIVFWEHPGSAETVPPPHWWLWSPAGFRAFLRTIPSLAAFLAVMVVLGIVSAVPDSNDGVAGTVVVIATLALALVWFGLMLVVILVAVYNRPKWAVPPRFRADEGMATAAARAR